MCGCIRIEKSICERPYTVRNESGCNLDEGGSHEYNQCNGNWKRSMECTDVRWAFSRLGDGCESGEAKTDGPLPLSCLDGIQAIGLVKSVTGEFAGRNRLLCSDPSGCVP